MVLITTVKGDALDMGLPRRDLASARMIGQVDVRVEAHGVPPAPSGNMFGQSS